MEKRERNLTMRLKRTTVLNEQWRKVNKESNGSNSRKVMERINWEKASKRKVVKGEEKKELTGK